MPETWPISLLGDLVTFVSGSGFPEHLQGRDFGELPFYKVSDMSSPGNEIYLRRARNYVSIELARRRGWKIAPAGAIAFAKVGAALLLNRRRKLSVDSLIDNNMIAVDPKDGIYADWLYWQLMRVDFANIVQDGALPSVNQRQLAEIKIPNPGLLQEEMASRVLNTVDAAIRETEAIIAKLKVIKQGLLHDLLTRGIDENGELRSPPEMAPHLYKDSSLGSIPNEWDVRTLNDLVDPKRPIVYGILMPGYGYPRGVPVVKVKDISDGKIRLDNLLLTSPQTDREYSRSRLVGGDLLFTIRGTVGRTAFVPPVLDASNITQDTARLAIRGIDARFVQAYLSMPISARFITVHTLGVAVQGINLRDVRRIPIAAAPADEAKEISNRIDAHQARLESEGQQLAKLRLAKSGLMDDLLTGRVRVAPAMAPEK